MADILLLETDRQLASHTAGILKRAGHHSRHFSDPQKAVAVIDKNRPDLIIIDLFLAPHSGIEFLYELRSYPEWEAIAVIITGNLSAEEIKAYGATFGQLGIQAYVQKSASLAELAAAADQVLQPAAG